MKLIEFSRHEDTWEFNLWRFRVMWLPNFREWSVGNQESTLWVAWKGIWLDFCYHIAREERT